MIAPLANETPGRALPIQINWEPSGSADEVQLVFSLSFINDGLNKISISGLPDTGSNTIAGGDLNDSDIAGNVEVTKNRLGTLDPAIGSGRIVGHQARRVTFTTTD